MFRCLFESALAFCFSAICLQAQPVIANPSFESPNIGACPNHLTSPADSWTFGPNAEIAAVGCTGQHDYNAPILPTQGGNQVAVIHGTPRIGRSTWIRQRVDGFVADHAYRVSFLAAGRPPSPTCRLNCGPLTFSVLAGDIDIRDVVDPAPIFQRYSTNPFTAPSSLMIVFTATVADDKDRSAFIDAVTIEDLGPARAISSLIAPPSIDYTKPQAQTLSGVTRTIPTEMVECEQDKCEGLWVFHGNRNGSVNWQNGGHSALTISRFDADGVTIHRDDGNGTTADYAGTIEGNTITGDVVLHYPRGRPVNGKWSASFGEAVSAQVAAARQREATDGRAFDSDEPEWKKKGFDSYGAYEANQESCNLGKACRQ